MRPDQVKHIRATYARSRSGSDLDMASVSLVEIERLLARQRMILERLIVHFEGLRPGTAAASAVMARR